VVRTRTARILLRARGRCALSPTRSTLMSLTWSHGHCQVQSSRRVRIPSAVHSVTFSFHAASNSRASSAPYVTTMHALMTTDAA
jgi:hypothetical protein